MSTLPLFMLALSALAAESGGESYRFGSKSVKFVRLEAEHLSLSEGCLTRQNACACRACEVARGLADTAKRARMERAKQIKDENPGAVLCSERGGESAVGLDARGNERSFCAFSDGSMVSNGSLLHQLKSAKRPR